MDLSHFVIKGQVLSLFRKALRVAAAAPPDTRRELTVEIRHQFEVSRKQADSYTVKHLLSDGRVKLKMLKEMVWFSQ